MTRIINLTQHPASPEQLAVGVVDFEGEELKTVKKLLTFDSLPQSREVRTVATLLACLAADSGCEAAMIGGAPFLMAPLEKALEIQKVNTLYAFSKRESVETVVNGEVVKTSVFSHLGFVEVDCKL